ncbi:thioester reductase domain-containing protein [Stappia sp. ES.058]|nr:thioester reductase domain-containing protein [Stappia sp. ES.058]
MQRHDLTVLHETLSAPYLELHSRRRAKKIATARQEQDLPSGEEDYVAALNALAVTSKGRVTLSKELICFFDTAQIEDAWLRHFAHVFLVRDPAAALRSLWRVSCAGPTTYYDPNEVDYARMRNVYSRVVDACGMNSAMVLEADDDLLADTENALRRFCEFAGLDFCPAMLEWKAEDVQPWNVWKGWHDDAAKSSGFQAPTHETPTIPESIAADIAERAVEAAPVYQAFSLAAARERHKFSGSAVKPLLPLPDAQAQLLFPTDIKAGIDDLVTYAGGSSNAFEVIGLDCARLEGLGATDAGEAARILDRPLLLPAGAEAAQKAVAKGLGLKPALLPPLSAAPGTQRIAELRQEAVAAVEAAVAETTDHVLKANAKTRIGPCPADFAVAMSSVAKAHPDLCVLTDGSASYTASQYAAELVRVGNILRQTVGGRALEPRWIVIFATRSAETVLAMSACLAVGLPFLEIPVWYRDDHVEEIIDKLDPALALCDAAATHKLRGRVPTLGFDELASASGSVDGPKEWPSPSQGGPKDLAHGVLTSGTTSVSKIVRIPQSQVFDSLDTFAKYIAPGDRLGLNMWLTCYVFYPPLLGATSVVVPDAVVLNPHAFVEFVQSERLTQLMVTPSLLEALIGLGPALTAGLSELHTLWISGEAMPSPLWDTAASLLPNVRFLNLYGINETGDVGIAFDASGRFELFPGIEVYILDDGVKMVPDGAIGDMHIASHGLSDGYVRDEEAARRNFVPNPFRDKGSTEPPVLYRAGDRVRRDPSGRISFAGRDTAHLKLRGFKIDPGRIESVLLGHPDIEAAVVKTRGSSSKKELVAYVVPAGRKEPTGRELRAYCVKHLPSYAVPNAFFAIDDIPLAGSKKRDEGALGERIKGRKLAENEVHLPETQKTVIQAFYAVLGSDLPALGAQDSFFDFGGSLQLLELQRELNRRAGVDLSLEHVFEDPTVEALARHIDAHKAGHAPVSAGNRFDAEAEAADLPLPPPRVARAARHMGKQVLLTGATGFVGRYVLAELAEDPEVSRVFCVVRADDTESAYERTSRAAPRRAKSVQPVWAASGDKIVAVAGDITRANLGLSDDATRDLEDQVDTVIHCAAEVNWIKPYQNLKKPNVLGTANVAVFAARAGASVTMLSTVPTNGAASGYHHSKLVCEAYARRCAEETGLPIRVIRCGDIAAPADASLRTDVNEDDYIVLLLRAALELGVWPGDVDWAVNLAPVDGAARAIISTAKSDGPGARTSVLINSESLSWTSICAWIAEDRPSGAFRETTLMSFRDALEEASASPAVQRATLVLQGSLDDLEHGPDRAGLPLAADAAIPRINRDYILQLLTALKTAETADMRG